MKPSHVARRKAEIAAGKVTRKPRKSYVRTKPGAPIPLSRSDAATLRHIARQIERAGMEKFAAELNRIATAGEDLRTLPCVLPKSKV